MVKMHGLTHIALAVRDPERSFRFYELVFGMVAVYRDDGFIQAQTPGSRDVLVFEKEKARAGKAGGAHFGFRLVAPPTATRSRSGTSCRRRWTRRRVDHLSAHTRSIPASRRASPSTSR